MRFNHPKATLRTTVLAVFVLLLGASWAVAQQQINLTAGPTSITSARWGVGADVGLQLRATPWLVQPRPAPSRIRRRPAGHPW